MERTGRFVRDLAISDIDSLNIGCTQSACAKQRDKLKLQHAAAFSGMSMGDLHAVTLAYESKRVLHIFDKVCQRQPIP